MINIERYSEAFNNAGCVFKECETPEEKENLYRIFKEVVEKGEQFPYENSSKEEYELRFFSGDSRVFICLSKEQNVLGGFYLRTNKPEISQGVANSAYMVDSLFQGKGLGTLLINTSISLAKDLGYNAMQYNQVFISNTKAIAIYEKLGFKSVRTFGGKYVEMLLNF